MLTNILIIDDDIFLRELIKDILIDYPVNIFEAGNGDQGLELLKQEPIHLVITDIIMPEKEGLESIIEIIQKYPGIKILAISGGGSTGSEQYLEMASNLGAHATLAKPFDKDDLLEKLNELTDNRFI
ncbi:MAG: response regulator [Salinivirgaceae bacterium]|nr:MAG: response regulator [Salinivirgaceae bacterium]